MSNNKSTQEVIKQFIIINTILLFISIFLWCTTYHSCDRVIHQSRGVIYSHLQYPYRPYYRGQCQTTLQAPRNKRIYLKFNEFHLKDSCSGHCLDRFEVIDGGRGQGPVSIHKYCGKHIRLGKNDRQFCNGYISSANQILLVFDAVNESNYGGFKIKFTAFNNTKELQNENDEGCDSSYLEKWVSAQKEEKDKGDDDEWTILGLIASFIGTVLAISIIIGIFLSMILVLWIIYQRHAWLRSVTVRSPLLSQESKNYLTNVFQIAVIFALVLLLLVFFLPSWFLLLHMTPSFFWLAHFALVVLFSLMLVGLHVIWCETDAHQQITQPSGEGILSAVQNALKDLFPRSTDQVEAYPGQSSRASTIRPLTRASTIRPLTDRPAETSNALPLPSDLSPRRRGSARASSLLPGGQRLSSARLSTTTDPEKRRIIEAKDLLRQCRQTLQIARGITDDTSEPQSSRLRRASLTAQQMLDEIEGALTDGISDLTHQSNIGASEQNMLHNSELQARALIASIAEVTRALRNRSMDVNEKIGRQKEHTFHGLLKEIHGASISAAEGLREYSIIPDPNAKIQALQNIDQSLQKASAYMAMAKRFLNPGGSHAKDVQHDARNNQILIEMLNNMINMLTLAIRELDNYPYKGDERVKARSLWKVYELCLETQNTLTSASNAAERYGVGTGDTANAEREEILELFREADDLLRRAMLLLDAESLCSLCTWHCPRQFMEIREQLFGSRPSTSCLAETEHMPHPNSDVIHNHQQ